MNRIAVVAAVVTISACSKPAQDAGTPAAAASPATASLAADGKPSVGEFKVTTADGATLRETVSPDGTYAMRNDAGQVVGTGKWEQKAPGTFCATPDKPGAKQVCRSEGIDASGRWTSTPPGGATDIVERLPG